MQVSHPAYGPLHFFLRLIINMIVPLNLSFTTNTLTGYYRGTTYKLTI